MAKTVQAVLLEEARLQSGLLRNLRQWQRLLWGFSGIGILLIAWNVQQSAGCFALEICGGVLAGGCLLAALVVHHGLCQGQKNVEKILCRLEQTDK